MSNYYQGVMQEGNALFDDTLNTFYLWKEGNALFDDTLNTFYLWKEGNVLFNDALNTFYLRFYLWLYGIGHMPQHGLLFLISSKGSFICNIPQTG